MLDLREQLQRCFQGSVCLIGLGNIDCGDDGFGVFLADALTQRLSVAERSAVHTVMNAGTMPERYLGSIADKGFNHILFLDAAEFGGAPGSVIFLNAEEMAARFPQISTHKISVGLLAKWVEEGGTTKAWMLGVQPGSVKSARGLTAHVQTTLTLLTELFSDLWTAGETGNGFELRPEEQLIGLRAAEVNA
jgi:hydrogenase maturation protease